MSSSRSPFLAGTQAFYIGVRIWRKMMKNLMGITLMAMSINTFAGFECLQRESSEGYSVTYKNGIMSVVYHQESGKRTLKFLGRGKFDQENEVLNGRLYSLEFQGACHDLDQSKRS